MTSQMTFALSYTWFHCSLVEAANDQVTAGPGPNAGWSEEYNVRILKSEESDFYSDSIRPLLDPNDLGKIEVLEIINLKVQCWYFTWQQHRGDELLYEFKYCKRDSVKYRFRVKELTGMNYIEAEAPRQVLRDALTGFNPSSPTWYPPMLTPWWGGYMEYMEDSPRSTPTSSADEEPSDGADAPIDMDVRETAQERQAANLAALVAAAEYSPSSSQHSSVSDEEYESRSDTEPSAQEEYLRLLHLRADLQAEVNALVEQRDPQTPTHEVDTVNEKYEELNQNLLEANDRVQELLEQGRVKQIASPNPYFDASAAPDIHGNFDDGYSGEEDFDEEAFLAWGDDLLNKSLTGSPVGSVHGADEAERAE